MKTTGSFPNLLNEIFSDFSNASAIVINYSILRKNNLYQRC
jgi:hypothetical protein